MPGRLLGVQRTDWGHPQIHPYAESAVMEHPWTMLGPPAAAQDALFTRSATSRRYGSESTEYPPEVRNVRLTPLLALGHGPYLRILIGALRHAFLWW